MHEADNVLLRIFVAEDDVHDGRCLYRTLVEQARQAGLAGATVLPGPLGFGRSRRLRSAIDVDAGPRLPVIVKIVDENEKVDSFLRSVGPIIGSGLVTGKPVRARFYGQSRPDCVHDRSESSTYQHLSRISSPATSGHGQMEGRVMDIMHDAVILRVFASTADHAGVEPLYAAIIRKAREQHLAGATVLRGPLGFGRSGVLHGAHLWPLTQALPVVIEIVDSEEHINAFLPILDDMMESGLVTTEHVLALRYDRPRRGLVERLLHPRAATAAH